MNEEKYYTPQISDLRVGYECEILLNEDFESSNNNVWRKHTFNQGNFTNYAGESNNDWDNLFWYNPTRVINHRIIRTPFLTKEQIEAEGWEYRAGYYIKDTMRLYFWNIEPEYRTPRITIDSTLSDGLYFSFFGECKSINELRYISKLLNIK